MPKERTFAMLKPGVLQRRLVGEVLGRLENQGFCIIAIKMLQVSRELGERHYGEHKGKAFYEPLMTYMLSGPSIAMVLERENAIKALRHMAGATNPEEAAPGSIRGDYGVITRRNILHASDSPESAAREIGIFFSPEELYPWVDGNEQWF
ncbi:MAG: nucleoside-diphosphate kinase [Spirochaetales bacterium]|nr:MAG: nucleoside-diphosphate kinase [Spirochaetales bacterium]